ncbi:DUF6481 family protein [Chelatococcus sp. GCM10030263]|uniref:DUF6481 family protein n=1 Tax=Chelatococcus sp. GCM10030263 TaxID=3273387 RepID=UPI00361A873E
MKPVDSFADRRKTAAAAKARLIDNLKKRPAPDDPAVLAKAATRQAIAAARAERKNLRELEEKAQREAAAESAAAQERAHLEEQAALEAAAQAEVRERQQLERERVVRVIADEAERKARRDLRYAARKQRAAR